MEGVLNKLLGISKFSTSTFVWTLGQNNSNGIYFDGYGVVFFVEKSNALLSPGPNHLEAVEIYRNSVESPAVVLPRKHHLSDDKTDKTMPDLKENVTEFLASYADAIGQLKPADRITVVVSFDNRGGWLPVPPPVPSVPGQKESAENAQIAFLEVSTLKKDIVDYKKGTTDLNTFRKQVRFDERLENAQVDRNIAIMSNILDTALSSKYQTEFSTPGDIVGMSLQGLGALFFTTVKLHSDSHEEIHILFDRYLEDANRGIVTTKKSTRKPAQTEEVIGRLKSELIKLCADYGHTLRMLQPDDHIVICTDFSKGWGADAREPQRSILKVTKRDVDRYNKRQLTFAQFEKKVVFIDY
jgi:tRNA (Thr-GGU) A37 N-methylase